MHFRHTLLALLCFAVAQMHRATARAARCPGAGATDDAFRSLTETRGLNSASVRGNGFAFTRIRFRRKRQKLKASASPRRRRRSTGQTRRGIRSNSKLRSKSRGSGSIAEPKTCRVRLSRRVARTEGRSQATRAAVTRRSVAASTQLRSRRIVINSGTSTQSISTVGVFGYRRSLLLKTHHGSRSITRPNAPNYHSVVEVIAVDMPEKVLTEVKSVAHVKTVETFGDATSGNSSSKVTLEVHCDDVPGGVVSHTSKHAGFGQSDRSRSTLELVDYEAIHESSSSCC